MRAVSLCIVFTLFIPLSFASFPVDTPDSPETCEDIAIIWQGGIAPYQLSILSDSFQNPTIETLGSTTNAAFSWNVNIEAGNSVIILVQDSTGDFGESLPFTIHPTSGSFVCQDPPIQPNINATFSPPPPNGTSSVIGGGGGSGTDGSSSASQGQGQPTSLSRSSEPPPPSPTGVPTDLPPTSEPSTSTSAGNFAANSFALSLPPTNSASASTDTIASQTLFPTSSSDPDSTVEGTGRPAPAISVLPSDSSSSSATGQSVDTNNFAKKNVVMSGAIIGGIVAAVLCAVIAALCVIRRCRRRRKGTADRVVYPFSPDAEHSSAREMVGRSGYPASTFSSWGNHGDDRALSPIAITAAESTEASGPSQQSSYTWDAAQGQSYDTIESRYAAAMGYAPQQTASASSADGNESIPRSYQHQRLRAPIPKLMMDQASTEYPYPSPGGPPSATSTSGPSSSSAALLGDHHHRAIDQGYNAQEMAHGHLATGQAFGGPRPQATPWETAYGHDGRSMMTVSIPPPYTSN